MVFQAQGLLDGEQATAFPKHEQILADQSRVSERVVVSNKCVTSKAVGTAIEFSLELVRCLFGEEKRTEIADSIVAQ